MWLEFLRNEKPSLMVSSLGCIAVRMYVLAALCFSVPSLLRLLLLKREERQLKIVRTSNAICPLVWDDIVSKADVSEYWFLTFSIILEVALVVFSYCAADNLFGYVGGVLMTSLSLYLYLLLYILLFFSLCGDEDEIFLQYADNVFTCFLTVCLLSGLQGMCLLAFLAASFTFCPEPQVFY
ncbi:putative superoxide dismutase [Rosa chinensis]|uniref:Putative superoxide dismutase n=1 Tax=Rosa chinensis TaxID=74649 RepID=A0A2P6S861_ROSCH|nr:putative superoxide dismutase [Rosa chinensis]